MGHVARMGSETFIQEFSRKTLSEDTTWETYEYMGI